MLNLISRNTTSSVLKLPSIYKPWIHSLSSTSSLSSSIAPSNLNLVKYSSTDNSFTVTYLIDSCGFSPEKAISASKYLTIKSSDKPDSVIQFFKDQGFTEKQTLHLIHKFPVALSCNPEKNLLPKFEFLTSIGLSSSDIVKLLTARPKSLGRSLKNHLEPTFKILKDLLQSNDRTLIAIRRCAWVLDWDFQGNLIPNMQLLRDVGVPGAKMLYVLTYQPRDFLVSTDQFKKAVEEVMDMGFDPMKTHFMLAVHALRSMTKSTWDKKMETYEKWGWSKDEILLAFRTDPWCMMKSEEKIDTVMDFLVNKMGFETSVIAKNSILISLSMEKRIIPRCLVYEYCLAKGLLTSNSGFSWWLRCSESIFIKRLQKYEKEAPGVLKFYQEKLDRPIL
ncbi:transcription termination factor MTERF15, mitochondrial-like [Rutidosis leptorrhynchoides]|uniref:transcription termination factor MTERF15, mitochondrial-like n=1 Tax=Rutidosis leptorrhynchoides TaxID=125765 RepID=UPI003A9999E7